MACDQNQNTEKVNQQWMKNMLSIRKRMSTNDWSQSVFQWMKEQYNKYAAIPIPGAAFCVMVERRRTEVEVSMLSAEQRREPVQAKEKELSTFVKYFCGRSGIASRDLTVCSDETALGRDS